MVPELGSLLRSFINDVFSEDLNYAQMFLCIYVEKDIWWETMFERNVLALIGMVWTCQR